MVLDALIRSQLSASVKQKVKALGFFDCGISPVVHLIEEEKKVEKWLEKGMHGEMSWMERNKEKRYDPSKLVKGAKSVITVLDNYKAKNTLFEDDGYKVSSYAYGKDYHVVVKDKLYQLLQFIQEKSGKRNARVFVDSAPVLDRVWAHKSGLGFIGKNTLLINRKGGSFFFIGHIILDLELEYEDKEAEKNFCGSCKLCLQACPTKALTPFELDARKCISYLTIESKSEIPAQFKGKFENWIFGCDICQDVCPWNREVAPHSEKSYEPLESLINMSKKDWENLDEIQFSVDFKNSPLERAGIIGMKRNVEYLND